MPKLSEMNQGELERYVDGGQYSDQDVIDLYNQFKRAVKVLKWYANRRNHERDIDAFKVLPSNVMKDEGQRAKEFLSSLSQGTEEG